MKLFWNGTSIKMAMDYFGDEVDFYVGGVVQAPARYYTEDRADAEGTAEAWVAATITSERRRVTTGSS